MKDIVGRRAAGPALIGWNQKTEYPDDDQQRGEYQKDKIIKIFHAKVFVRGAPPVLCPENLFLDKILKYSSPESKLF